MAKFGAKTSKLSAFPENLRTQYLQDADSYSDISFLNFQPYFHFWVNLSQTIKSCPFCLKTGTKSISRMFVLILALVFWNSKPKSIFRENLSQKSQIVYFAWMLAHRVSQECDSQVTEEGLEAKTKMNNWIKCLFLTFFIVAKSKK